MGQRSGSGRPGCSTSSTEIQVPAPPAETSDQTKAELAELRQLQKERSPSANTAIQYYNAVPATQRWHDLAHTLARAEKQSLNRQAYLAAILHTALHDAVIVTWAAKYQFNRKPPSQLAPDVTPVVPITGAVAAPEPSYPSEHAALAGTAVGILTAFFPKEEANLKATAAEVGQTRLLMGANYRSDIDAGFALGQAVAQKALARAATDGADAKWTGTVPTGPGLWVGKDPLEPLMGTWKPWLMTRGDQFRPEPPPAFDSAAFQEELALLKRINSSPTPSQRAIATNFAVKGLDFVWEPAYALVAPGAAQRAPGGAAAGTVCRPAVGRLHRRARCQIPLLASAAQHGGHHDRAVDPAAEPSRLRLERRDHCQRGGGTGRLPCSRRRRPAGSIWARRPASPASTAASTTPAMSVLAIRWARASPRWRSSAISSTGRRAGSCTRHSNRVRCILALRAIARGSATTSPTSTRERLLERQDGVLGHLAVY